MSWKTVLAFLFIIGAIAALVKGKGVSVLLVFAALFGLMLSFV